MNHIFLFILGLILMGLGIGLIKNPVFYDSRHQIVQNFTGIEWFVGGAFFAVGLYSIFLVTKKKLSGEYIGELICSKCEEVVEYSNLRATPSCPKCAAKLEKLEGFYERHPELKN